jgi:Fur family peroxide stress response transcriptional regulator
MKIQKYSRQRESIINYLKSTKEHPTADTVYMNIRNIYPNVSLGTVYRNLNLLVEQGDVSKIICGDGSVRYDGNPMQHYHFICTDCSSVQDLEMPPESLKHIDLIASTGFEGDIHGHTALFYGRCFECKKNYL